MISKVLFFIKKNIIVFSIISSVVVVSVSLVLAFNIFNKGKQETKMCLVQFEASGGQSIDDVNVKCGNVITAPNNPQKNGFIFDYWEYNGEKFNFESPIMVDMLLTAVYKVEDGVEIVTVTFDTTGGTKIKPIELKKGELLNKPVTPKLSGYVFSGWYLDYKEFDFSQPITKNITLKAKWENKEELDNKDSIKMNKSPDGYKCSATFRGDVPEKNVTVGYYDNVGWTWSVYGGYGGRTADVCYVTYKTSNSKIASVDKEGFITAKKAGEVYISLCANDTETKKELACFVGKLNIMDANDTTTVLSQYDEIANKYSGIWYLTGYSDVYIDVFKYKVYYEAMDITPMQIDIYNGGLYPGAYGNIQISYSDWDNDLKKYNVHLNNDNITIQTPKGKYVFVKEKGTKNKYSDTLFYQSLGTWYPYNKPDSSVEIYKGGDDNNPRETAYYCITTNRFNIKTFDTNTSSNFGCNDATNNDLFNRLGMSFNNGEMIINSGGNQIKLYKTKKVVSVDQISINTNNLNMIIGETYNLVSNISPSDAYNKNVRWSSTNSSVVKVDNNGKVTALKSGSATVTVTTDDGNKTASCYITVDTIKVESITISDNNIVLTKGNSKKVSANVSPSNATNKKVIWSSENSSIAKVDSDGKITGVNKGVTTITATTEDGGKTASCLVTVNNPPISASADIGITTKFSGNNIIRGIDVTVKASGGTGVYTYYYIKLYRNDVLIGESPSTNTNSLFVTGYTNGSYYVEYEVRDSDNVVYKNRSATTTISGF